MAIPSNVEEALDRLGDGYNNEPYNPATNPLGFSKAGHRTNLFALTDDVVTVGEWMDGVAVGVDADQVAVAADRATVTASAASVAANKAAVDAALAAVAGGPVISINGKTGVVFTDPTTVVDVQPTFDFNLTSLSGAPFRDGLTRATDGGMRLTSRGLLASTAINEPVIDFGADGKPKGTGFFGAYTNLLTYSEQFDNAAWAKQRTTVTADAIAAPDGVSSADKIIESVTAGSSYVAQSYTFAAAIYTWSVFAKAAEKTQLDIYLVDSGGGTANARIGVNLATGTITGAGGTILALPNGWYLITGTTAANMVAGAGTFRIQLAGTELDDGTSGLYLWGAQLTQTAFPVPYVPTTSAAVVRNADSFIISGSDFTDFYNQTEGTFFIDVMVPAVASATSRYCLTISDGTSANSILYGTLSDNRHVVAGGSNVSLSINGPPNTGLPTKVAISIRAAGVSVSINGAAVLTDSTLTLPTALTTLSLGVASWGPAGYWGGFIKRLIYWPKAFDATTLQRMTA